MRENLPDADFKWGRPVPGATGGHGFPPDISASPPSPPTRPRRFSLFGKPAKYGTLVVVSLVLLRLAIGWHFFQEGGKKLREGKFTSAHFFRAAKGPWAGFYRDMIPDGDGLFRLNPKSEEEFGERWTEMIERIASRFDFDDEQLKEANEANKKWKLALHNFYADNRDELAKYRAELNRLEAAESASIRELASQRDWIARQRTTLRGQAIPWLAKVDSFQMGLESELYDIAGYDIRPANPNSMYVDTVVTWLTFLAGVCLILGLFTPVAAIAGALFLFMVMATQPPWVQGAEPIYYQSVEFVAMLVLAFTRAGQWFGLDFLVQALWVRCCRSCCRGKSK